MQITRKFTREGQDPSTGIEFAPPCLIDFPPDDEAELIRLLPTLIRGESVQNAAFICGHYLNQLPVTQLAKEQDRHFATAYNKITEVRAASRTLRDLRQPPHAAD